MPPRQRLTSDDRRTHLLTVGAELFAATDYHAVSMDEVALRGGVSRALVYRHFPSKRDLFAAIYQQAADQLLGEATFDADLPLAEQVVAGLDAHFDYFLANRNTVLAANRTLGGDPVIQAIIEGELDVLRSRMLDAVGLIGSQRERMSAILLSWLVFVRILTIEWLTTDAFTRDEMRDTCVGALIGALGDLVEL